MQGTNHPQWKGGKRLHNGYTFIFVGNDKYTPEHRLIWEKAYNKKIPKGWHIHHLNGIKSDNRLENLIALSSKKHSLVLSAKAKRIQKLEGLLNKQIQLL